MKPVMDAAPEAEQALLGALLSDARVYDQLPALDPEWFYAPAHQHLAREVIGMILHRESVDPITVMARLEERGLLGKEVPRDMPIRLVGTVGTHGNVAHYAKAVQEAWGMRQLRAAALRVVTDPELKSVEKTSELLGNRITAVETGKVDDKIVSLGDLFIPFTDRLDAQAAGTPGAGLISTGFRALDDKIGGFEPGVFQLYAARPGVGKSALATAMARNLGRAGIPVAIFWLEDTRMQFALRVYSAEGKIPSILLRDGRRLKQPDTTHDWWQQLYAAGDRTAKWPVYIEDTKGLSMTQVAAKMRRLHREKGVRVFIVDHLGKIPLHEDRVDMALGNAAQVFMDQAGTLDACPVAFHQLSRKAEDKDATPDLGWLFNSDVLGQHARVVGYMDRPTDMPKVFRIYFAKCTYGPGQTEVCLGWDSETMNVMEPIDPTGVK